MLSTMMARIQRARLGIAAVIVATSSCMHHRRAAAGDTIIHGIVSITGTSFAQQLQLRTTDGMVRLSAQPADSAALARLGGLELAVHGARETRGFHVSGFTVLRAGHQPVTDGVVIQDGPAIALQTSAGKRALGNPPDELRQMIGARVWIAGPLDAGPNSYGVIIPRP